MTHKFQKDSRKIPERFQKNSRKIPEGLTLKVYY
jgi:hypothetical protein